MCNVFGCTIIITFFFFFFFPLFYFLFSFFISFLDYATQLITPIYHFFVQTTWSKFLLLLIFSQFSTIFSLGGHLFVVFSIGCVD